MTKAIKRTIVTILLLCIALAFACFTACDFTQSPETSTNPSQNEQTENTDKNNGTNDSQNGETSNDANGNQSGDSQSGSEQSPKHTCSFVIEKAEEKYLKSATTCTEKAVYYKSCSCGEKGTETFEYGEAKGHDYGEWKSNGDGTHTKTCKNDSSHTVTESCHGGTATCTEQATCEDCNAKYGTALGHSYTNYVSDNNATCVDNATETAACDNGCGTSDTRAIENSALGHTESEWIIDKNANCTEDGSKQKECLVCHKILETETIKSLGGHSYKSGECTRCGERQPASEGLAFSLDTKNKGYSVSKGTCSDTEIVIPSEYKGLPVTSINGMAFSFMNMRSIVIPDSVTYIGEAAFKGCSSLYSITMPAIAIWNSERNPFGYIFGMSSYSGSTATRQGCYNFNSYTSKYNYYYIPSVLRAVTITSGEILAYSFYNCTGLTSITIGNKVTSVEASAFDNCTGLTSVTIGSEATSISLYAFSDCNSIKYNKYDNADYLGNYANPYLILFKAKDSYITSCTIHEKTKSIGKDAFRYCSSLVSVTIGNSVTSIGNSAFYNCSKLTSITIGNSVTNIGKDAFKDCSSIENVYIGDINNWVQIEGLYYLMYSGKSFKSLYVNEELLSEAKITTATKINSYAFYNCSSLSSIEIPNSVTSIGNIAFYNCSSLTSIEIPNSVTSIGSSAFCYCSSLVSVTIGNGVTSIGDYAFYNCSKLTSITIGNSVTSIGEEAFRYCSSLVSVTIPDSVTSIGEEAFSCCSSLASIDIPNSVTSIGSLAFCYCSSLVSVTIPDSVTSIGRSAFSGCNKLQYNEYDNAYYLGNETNEYLWLIKARSTSITKCTINEKCKFIYHFAFEYCSSLTSITIPNSVTSIGDYAFYYCSSLVSVTIPDSVTSIGSSAFEGCSSLVSVTIGNNVTSIGSSAFRDCSSLEDIAIPFVGASKTAEGYQAVFGYIFGYTTKSSNDTISGATYQYYVSASSSYYHYYIPTSIKSVIITGGDIPYNAFYNCNMLTSVTIGKNVTGIEAGAFSNCTSLTEINYNVTECEDLNDSSGSIFYNAGKDGDGMKLTIGKNVKKIPEYLFGNAYITEVVFEEGSVCESIGSYAFSGCSSLTSITIPNSVTSIGSSAFRDCSSLTSITIPNSVTSIGSSAFRDCSSLEEITIPFVGASKTAEGYQAVFGYIFGCYTSSSSTDSGAIHQYTDSSTGPSYKYTLVKYYHYYIPTSIKSVIITGGYIPYNAFYNCNMLTSVTIGNSVTSIDNSAFVGCSSLKYNEYDNAYYLGNETNKYLVLIKAKSTDIACCTINENCKFIYHAAFYNCSSLTSITISDSVTSIGDYAFYGCSSLVSVTIPDSVTSIGDYAFYYCRKLTSITIPNSVTSIGDYAFSGCSSLVSVTIPNSVTSIGRSAFSGCSSLTSISVAEDNANYKSVDGNLYSKDGKTLIQYAIGKKDTSFIIPDSVTSIGRSAFSGCSSLVSVTIPNSVTSIGDYAFSGCSSLTSIEIPDSVTSIGNSAFYKCSSLVSVTIPDSVTNIGDEAFEYCSSLIYSIYGNACYLGNETNKCLVLIKARSTDITSCTINENCKFICNSAFLDCSKLMSITIPNSVKSIGRSAFWGCSSLTSVTIPNSVTSIEYFAFSRCSRLTSVTFENPNGWVASDYLNVTYRRSLKLTDATQNATYLKDTYHDSYWKRG